MSGHLDVIVVVLLGTGVQIQPAAMMDIQLEIVLVVLIPLVDVTIILGVIIVVIIL